MEIVVILHLQLIRVYFSVTPKSTEYVNNAFQLFTSFNKKLSISRLNMQDRI